MKTENLEKINENVIRKVMKPQKNVEEEREKKTIRKKESQQEKIRDRQKEKNSTKE